MNFSAMPATTPSSVERATTSSGAEPVLTFWMAEPRIFFSHPMATGSASWTGVQLPAL
jgi:hypothetical protein